MRRKILVAVCTLLSCGEGTISVSTRAGEDVVGSIQHGLQARVQEKFGAKAHVEQVFGRDDEVLLGVALEETPEDSDVRSPLALAKYRRSTDALEVVSATAAYREARPVGDALALVSSEGELRVGDTVVATAVKGDVTTAGSRVLFTGEQTMGESAVMIASPGSGTPLVLADSDGVDDRPSVSPDGVTVVFVSGRTGVASLYRTTTDGAAPVQLTNLGLEIGLEREGPPEGFVPPPVLPDAIEWVSNDIIRYDAGGKELWRVDVRTGSATKEGVTP
jgi:hypothetical protein